MCIDALFGDGGGSESGPVWKSGDSDLISNILLSSILSKIPKKALSPMLNSEDSGLGKFLNRVYGSGQEDSDQTPAPASILGNFNPYGGSFKMPAANQSPRQSQVQSQSQALDNLNAYNSGDYNDMRPGARGYNILGGGPYQPGWQGQLQPFSGANKLNSRYRIF